MYPIVIIATAALLKKNKDIAYGALFLSGIGMLISIYHYSVQKVSFIDSAVGFCGDVLCNLQYINYFGFITIPFLAGLDFIVIFISSILLSKEVN